MTQPAFFPEPPDPWDWWRRAEKDPSLIGTDALPVHAEEPQVGYYRVRRKEGNWEPVAIFRDTETGILQAERNGRFVLADKIPDLWLWCCRQPISYDEWERASTGRGWADEPVPIAAIGDNIKEADPHDRLWIEWLGEKEQAEEILKRPITDQEAADLAAIWAKKLTKISNDADTQHRIEAEPSVAEKRRIDERWRDLRELPGTLAKRLKQHQKAFLDELDRKERERVAAAQREADRLRREASEKARAAEAEQRRAAEEIKRKEAEARRLAGEGKNAEAKEKEQEAAAAAAGAEKAFVEAGRAVAEMKDAVKATTFRNPSAGRTHARTKMVTYRSAIIDDIDVLFQACKAEPEVVALLQRIANAAAKARYALPGCTIVEDRRPA